LQARSDVTALVNALRDGVLFGSAKTMPKSMLPEFGRDAKAISQGGNGSRPT
jgi:hypothetical protein